MNFHISSRVLTYRKLIIGWHELTLRFTNLGKKIVHTHVLSSRATSLRSFWHVRFCIQTTSLWHTSTQPAPGTGVLKCTFSYKMHVTKTKLKEWKHSIGTTQYMEKSPSSVAKSRSASEEIPRLIWNPKIHYRVHRSPPLDPILSQVNLVHTFPPISLIPILILSSHLPIRLPSGLFPSGPPTKIMNAFLWSWDFATTKFDRVFSGYQPCQLSVWNRRFEDNLGRRHHHHHQGSDISSKRRFHTDIWRGW